MLIVYCSYEKSLMKVVFDIYFFHIELFEMFRIFQLY